jgi:hypothetical protein
MAPHCVLGDQPGNRPAVPGDNDAVPSLDVVQKLGQMGFRLGSLKKSLLRGPGASPHLHLPQLLLMPRPKDEPCGERFDL